MRNSTCDIIAAHILRKLVTILMHSFQDGFVFFFKTKFKKGYFDREVEINFQLNLKEIQWLGFSL